MLNFNEIEKKLDFQSCFEVSSGFDFGGFCLFLSASNVDVSFQTTPAGRNGKQDSVKYSGQFRDLMEQNP